MSGKFWTGVIPVVKGCTPASEGCARCWHAQEYHMRSHQKNPKIRARYEGFTEGKGRWNGRVEVDMSAFDRCAKDKPGQVYMVLSDLYHEGVDGKYIADSFEAMASEPQHTFLIITKRPERAPAVSLGMAPRYLNNIWHIVTVENQARADERIPHLLRIPGKRGIIIEPMLGAVDMSLMADAYSACLQCFWTGGIEDTIMPSTEEPDEVSYECPICGSDDLQDTYKEKSDIHQVILGGENGPGARPMHPDWVRSVRDQCKAAGVPFYFKGWGEWATVGQDLAGKFRPITQKDAKERFHLWHDEEENVSMRVGKKAAGRLLDGEEHDKLAWRG